MDLSEKIRQRLAEAPEGPGCYLMRNRAGRIIYIGKAASIRKRIQSYFREAVERQGDPKTRGLVRTVDDIEYRPTRTEAEALLTESRLIRSYKPQFNVRLRDDKRFLMLKLNRSLPWPRLEFCRMRTDSVSRYFGPYPTSAPARQLRDFAEKTFGLIRCTPRVPDEATHRHCIDDIVRHCSSPCIGRITREEYDQRLDEAAAFLEGRHPTALIELRKQMNQAAEERQYERAAAMRDTLLLLERALRRGVGVGETESRRREDGRAGMEELQAVLGLATPPRRIEGYDISNISGTFAVASLVVCEQGRPARNRYRRFRIRTVDHADDPAMMAETLARRFRDGGSSGDMPDLVMVDGGKTQLMAARRTLDAMGAGAVRVIGLAKRFEEIHCDDRDEPVRLSRHSQALRLLQRLRDEAHRFALDYHRRLRARRLRESALDEIPGIGPKRKEQLLCVFGSVRRLAKATVEEIAEVSGIGYELAMVIRDALATPATREPPSPT